MSKKSIVLQALLLLLAGNVLGQSILERNFGKSFLKDWHLLGPFPSEHYGPDKVGKSAREGYDQDFLVSLGGEEKAVLTHNTIVRWNDKDISCKKGSWESSYLDLYKIFGEKANVCAYLYTEFTSSKKQEVYLHAGFNDAGKVWVNGQQVMEDPYDGSAEPSEEIVPVVLHKGLNRVLIKLDQAGGGWGAYFELYDKSAHQSYMDAKKNVDKGVYIKDNRSIAEHNQTSVICKQVDRYIGWPSIAKTKDGELLVVFSGDRDEHVCPYGITQMVRSKDNGLTWSEPETINNTPLDDRDAGIIQTKDGSLVVSWFTSLAFDTERFYENNPDWKRHAGKLGPETRERWLGNWIRRSTDNGLTWEEPVKQNGTAPHGPIELKDGRLLYVGTGKIDGKKVNSVEESKDGGKTWNMISTIPIRENEDIKYFHEPHVAELPDGKLVAQIRYQPGTKSQSYLRQSESLDGGMTWSVAYETPMWGYPPHLIVLDNGWLLTVYGVRRKPYSERACISKDGGKTWDIENEIILEYAPNGDLGYPASVQLDDGSILTIYYQIDKEGEKTCLMGTHWRLK